MTQTECEKKLIEILETSDVYLVNAHKKQKIWSREFEEFAYPKCGYWFEEKHIPVMPAQIELGMHAMNKWKGILQVNICVYKDFKTRYPEYGLDIKDYVEYAYAAIAEVMKRGVIIDRVHITEVGKSSAIDNGNYYSVPVSINWYANLSN